jgi:deazaflavin-dependent oxidoreductase (nitroreductase family)
MGSDRADDPPRVGRRVARLNRTTNRLFRIVPAWFPGFGVVVHRGRRSGLLYRTPVRLFRREQRLVIARIYGTDSGWVKNVVAAGGCELLHLGRRTSLEGVEVVRDESRRLMPASGSSCVSVRARCRLRDTRTHHIC